MVFCKGGFVCLPIGLAAALLRIPLVIHDSDAHPGLTNRILSRFASSIATGAPLEHYPYPRSKTRYVGIPIREEFRAVNPQRRRELKKRLGFDVSVPLVVVTGGGLGARRINDTVAMILDELIKEGSVALLSGAAQYDELRSLTPSDSSRYRLFDFVSEGIHDLLNAADIVVARAGATTLLELAALHKATVIIPNAYLTGGHQLKNAAAYEEKGAAVVCSEAQLEQQPELLLGVLRDLIHDPTRRAALASGMAAFAKPHAARDVARMIVRVAMIK